MGGEKAGILTKKPVGASFVGARLARDKGTAVYSKTELSFIAGKPCSHRAVPHRTFAPILLSFVQCGFRANADAVMPHWPSQ